jgi:hypothetical protein
VTTVDVGLGFAQDALAAGFSSPEEVEAAMKPRGPIHRRLALPGRIRGSRCASSRRTESLLKRLDRMGAWTYSYLRLIGENPGVRAADLAELVDESVDFKRECGA